MNENESNFTADEHQLIDKLIVTNPVRVEKVLREGFNQTEDKEGFIASLEKILSFYDDRSNFFTVLNKKLINKGFEVLNILEEELAIGIKPPNFTPQQLTLVLYFTLKSTKIDITNSSTVNQSNLVRFLHIISGYSSSNLKNSKYYQLVRHAPNFNDRSIKSLHLDLNIIKPYFEKNGFDDAVSLIDAMLQFSDS